MVKMKAVLSMHDSFFQSGLQEILLPKKRAVHSPQNGDAITAVCP